MQTQVQTQVQTQTQVSRQQFLQLKATTRPLLTAVRVAGVFALFMALLGSALGADTTANAASANASASGGVQGSRVVEEYTATYYAITFDEKGEQHYNEGDFRGAAYFYKEAQRRYKTLGVQFPTNAIAKYGEALTAQYYQDAVLLMDNPAIAAYLAKEGEIDKTDGDAYRKLYDRVVKGRKGVEGKDDATYRALTLYQNRLGYIIILDASIDLKGGKKISDKGWKTLEELYNALDTEGRYYSKASLLLGWMRQFEASSSLKP